MNTYKSVILVIASILVSVTSCIPLKEDENHHFNIYVKNNWDKPILLKYGMDAPWYQEPFEKYYLPFIYNDDSICKGSYIIQPESIESDYMTYNDYYENLDIKDTIVMCFFDASFSDKKFSECFLVRYLLSKEDLKKIKFCVCYPPTDDMKDFYMYPLYEEVIRKSEETDSEDNIQNQ
mgnify:CR=1 FL=1